MDISAQNTFTPALQVFPGVKGYSASISGTFVATITVQRSKDEVNWFDLDTFTSPVELDGVVTTMYYIRAGVKTGSYTSGTAVVNVY